LSADLPILEGDQAPAVLLAAEPLPLLGVPPEEGPARIATDSPIVETTLGHWLVAYEAFYVAW